MLAKAAVVAFHIKRCPKRKKFVPKLFQIGRKKATRKKYPKTNLKQMERKRKRKKMVFHTHTAPNIRISRRKKSTPRSKITHINRIDAPDVHNYLHYVQRIEYIRSNGLLYTVTNPSIHHTPYTPVYGCTLYIEAFISILVWGLCDGFSFLSSFVFILMLLLTLDCSRSVHFLLLFWVCWRFFFCPVLFPSQFYSLWWFVCNLSPATNETGGSMNGTILYACVLCALENIIKSERLNPKSMPQNEWNRTNTCPYSYV